jgi:hypothetical protein
VLLYFTGDSVKYDYQKEVQVHEGQTFTLKCEVPETNPISTVTAYIDSQPIRLTNYVKKDIENRMSINTYSFDVNATRNMNGKRIRCEATMKDLPSDVANSIDLRSHIIKDAILSVYYKPTCVYPNRIYHTGINRSIIIECPINASNPDVTYYKMAPPNTRAKFELIDSDVETLRKVGRYRIQPNSLADFGLYECIPRSSAGTVTCNINVELGDTPNPPEQCTVQFAKVNNKTFAQFSCKPGFNQGGSVSFLTIYEKVEQQLKLSGRVNIDESKIDKEVPYITPADEDKYYEFLIMQENNHGNSTPILLTLGQSMEIRQSKPMDTKTVYTIAGIAGGIFLFVCVCACCCCNEFCSTTKSDNPCLKCCQSSDGHDDDGITYKKAPMDATLPNHQHQTFPYPTNDMTSKSHMAYSTNLNSSSNYDYYDNTSTGLLNDPYSRYSTQKSRVLNSTANQQQVKIAYGSVGNNNYDDDEIDEEEPYMNDQDDIMRKNTYSSNEEESTASSTNKNIDANRPLSGTTTATNVTPLNNTKTTTSKSLFANNNLSGLIGSGVESINKKNVYSNNNKKQQSTTYSTIDSRKYIKTENGLVYTAINGTSIQNGNKSSDALVIDDYDVDDIDDDDSNNDENHHYHYADEDTDFSRSNKNKNNNNNSYGNNIKLKTIQQNQNFKNELNQRLKTINKTDSTTPEPPTINQNDMLYSKNYSSAKVNTNIKPNSLPVQLNSNGTTNENSSTVTTSVSSASSCSSNSDLNVNNNIPTKQKLTSLNNNNNVDKNKNYSLLKTTLNGNSNSNTEIINETNKSQTKLNETLTNGTNKPPILKPKPRANNNYQTNPNFKKQLNSTSDSLHNQSNEPLLLLKETSLQTTPSTSVTDVSSNNCTPQHYNSNLIDDLTPVVNNNNNNQNKLIKQKVSNNISNQISRSRSNSLTRSNNKLNGQQSQQNLNKPNSNKVMNGYSTLNNKSLNNSNGGQTTVLKTFTNGNNISLYERINNTNMASIDDEINMTKAKQSNGNLLQQRTLERRVVKNSEC